MASQEPIPITQEGWTRELACDLFPGITTPLAWTLLRGPAETALRRVLMELGAATLPGTALWLRQADGRVYVAANTLAEAGAATHGAAWLGLQQPTAPAGPLARLQAGAAIRRAQARVTAAADEAPADHDRLARWLAWVHELRWTQADLLHVMEELEPRATGALHSYLTIRAGLSAAQTELGDRLNDAAPADVARLHGALFAGLAGLPTAEAAYALAAAARAAPADQARQETLARYGHRGPGELRPDAARWRDQPALLESLAALSPTRTLADATAQRRGAEAEAAGKSGGRSRSLSEALRRAHDLTRAADIAWDGLIMVLAAAQRWTQAAAQETLAAQLISRAEDVVYLELEELKQIATGEWHRGDADTVLAEVAHRQAAPLAPAPGITNTRPTPVSPGQARGPAFLGLTPIPAPPAGAIWLSESVDAGCAPFWLAAGGVASAAATPWTPGLLAACALGMPAVAGAGELVAHAHDGQQVTLDGETGRGAVV